MISVLIPSLRTLNRTLLARQLLLDRTTRPALEVVEHLVALQSQEPNWPYVGLWTRVADFRHDDLTELLHDRRVVRSAVLRGTQHVASGDDFRWLRPTVQPVLDRMLKAAYYARETAGIDAAVVADAGREVLAAGPLLRRQLNRRLDERFPGRNGGVLAGVVEIQVPIVHPPPGGTWGGWGTRASMPVTLAETWIGQPLAATPKPERLVHRYLAAFGPASVKDIQAWSGLTRLREVVDGMDLPRVGTDLVDLPDAPLADPDQPVPVRFLPAYDNLLLGHADRTRVIRDEDRPRVMPGQALVRPTFLVDGFVHGTWSLDGGTLGIEPFRPLSTVDREAVHDEAQRLRAFVAADAADAADAVSFV